MDTSTWLISRDEARTYLGVEGTEKPVDPWLDLVIGGLSREVMTYTGRQYRPRSAEAEAKLYTYDAGALLSLDDCTAPSAVRFSQTPSDDESWTDVGDDQWVAEPLRRAVKTQLRFIPPISEQMAPSGWEALALVYSGDRTRWPREDRAALQAYVAVEVTALWGWPEVPAEITLACCKWLDALNKGDQAYFSGDLANVHIDFKAMPPEVKQILDDAKDSSPIILAV
jgi:hypothetical protein